MNKSGLTLYMAPRKFWEQQQDPATDIFEFYMDALGIERRIKKEVNLINERMRYQLCCRRIQEAVLRMNLETEKTTLKDSYFDVLRFLYDKFPSEVIQARLTSCFFLPDELSKHNGGVDQLVKPAEVAEHLNWANRLLTQAGLNNNEIIKRLSFFTKASSEGAGIIEIADFLMPCEEDKSDTFTYQIKSDSDSTLFTEYQADDELSKEEHQKLLDILRSKIEKSLKTSGEVNFSNQPHSVIADALNEFVYKNDPDEPEKHIRVIYMDGSEAEPFPLRCLATPLKYPEPGMELTPLKTSLISMRHLKMDERVDFAWFRNRMVSVARPFAETDAYCTERTMELLDGITDEGLYIHLYQTGLETAVVGFYRGLVKVLKTLRNDRDAPAIRVEPFYFNRKDNDYRPGRVWI